MSSFSIDFEWLARNHGDAVARATLAEIVITVNGQTATETEDLPAKTVRRGARVSAHALACWFASNWWRLRWEPERHSFSWKMSHKMGAAGQGYLWPDLAFISDGAAVLVHVQPSAPNSREPLRYLGNFANSISAWDFEQGIDAFMDAVLERLSSAGAGQDELFAAWQEIARERRDPALASMRKLEALLGHDPGEAPGPFLRDLDEAARSYGAGAVEEMAAASQENALAHIHALWVNARPVATRLEVPGYEALRNRMRDDIPPVLFPWQKAARAARMAREAWSLGPGPVTTEALCQLFGLTRKSMEAPACTTSLMNAGFRDNGKGTLDVFLESRYMTSRRFALLRLAGDHLAAPPEDRLLPAAPGGVHTQRQKFQRAFAQEVLCPYAELKDFMGQATDSMDETMEDAARYFGVSPLMVRTILLNKGDLDRESFTPCFWG